MQQARLRTDLLQTMEATLFLGHAGRVLSFTTAQHNDGNLLEATNMKAFRIFILLLLVPFAAYGQRASGIYGTKFVLAGGGTDIMTDTFLIVAPSLAAPLTWTLPNANPGGAGYLLSGTTTGGLS